MTRLSHGEGGSERLPWLRLYVEIIDDEKLRLLAFEDRWHYVALLCCKRAGLLDSGDAPQLLQRKIAVKLGLQLRELEAMALRLEEVGLIDAATFQPLAWEGRQFRSDTDPTSRERKRRQRERDRERVTDMSRVTVTKVTRTDTDTDTDTDKSVRPTRACVPARETPPPDSMTDAGRACRLMREAGCVGTNPQHPDLLAALAAGVTPLVLGATAAEAIELGKSRPFTWAIATARGRLEETTTAPAHGAHRATGEPRASLVDRAAARARDILERTEAGDPAVIEAAG
jgi:hypothetical protein